MNTLLESVVPSVARASWQATALAVVVLLLVRSLGGRAAPRFRQLLWGVVLVRLLCVVTPASAWSAFNLLRSGPEVAARPGFLQASDGERPVAIEGTPGLDHRPAGPPATGTPQTHETAPVRVSITPATFDRLDSFQARAEVTSGSAPSPGALSPVPLASKVLAYLCLAGYLVLGLKFWGSSLLIRRRLAACRPVTDPAILAVLESVRQRIGLRRRPGLWVTPRSISPCVLGTWKPRIILPESLITDDSPARLRHVLTHELAHLVRGDLWTNWLLLAARLLHWFNPAAWWAIGEFEAERESACDDLVLETLGESERHAYATTILDLAASLVPSGFEPGMISLFSSNRRLRTRVRRLAEPPPARTLRKATAAVLVAILALFGLTDARPMAAARPQMANPSAGPDGVDPTEDETISLRGRCVDHANGSAIPGARVRLFKAQGFAAPILQIANTSCDGSGRFTFSGLEPPRVDDSINRLVYLVFAEADDRPYGAGGIWAGPNVEMNVEIHMLRDRTTLAGKVVDPTGRPVRGAWVAQWAVDGRPIPGILSAESGPDGRFVIPRIPHFDWLKPGSVDRSGLEFTVFHPDYPPVSLTVQELPALVTVTLSTGCQVTGRVTDRTSGAPAGGTVVLAERLGKYSVTAAVADASGRFRMVLAEDRYNFTVRAMDRVGFAITDRECLAGKTLELPPFHLIRGGILSGRVVNARTGQPLMATDQGEPIALGLLGPSQPSGNVIAPLRLATVDRVGRFRLRAAPGENFPYLVNHQGDRMAWNTTNQPAVRVRDGELTAYDMLVTPARTPEEKRKAARELHASHPATASDRTSRILREFRAFEDSVDKTESWCTLMRDLVAVGRDAVPQICAELDRTTENLTLRRLGFALRAIGDPRAIPALIRAIPRTLLPGSSDYGLIVEDAALAAFMRKHDLRGGEGRGKSFGFGRPVQEILTALRRLSGQDFDDTILFVVFGRSEDPRRRVLQRRLFTQQARRWRDWWEANWRTYTDDANYQKVGLAPEAELLPPPSATLGKKAQVEGRMSGLILSPSSQNGRYERHFLDLDTSAMPGWPRQIPRDEGQFDEKRLAAWAEDSGVDLMCVTHRAPDGTQTYALKSFGMKAWEMSRRDSRNLDSLIAAGTLPRGREVGELMLHRDEETSRLIPDANGTFLYRTREGSLGVIEVTDRVTRTADLTGMPGPPPAGIGFFKGVRFNLKEIIP